MSFFGWWHLVWGFWPEILGSCGCQCCQFLTFWGSVVFGVSPDRLCLCLNWLETDPLVLDTCGWIPGFPFHQILTNFLTYSFSSSWLDSFSVTTSSFSSVMRSISGPGAFSGILRIGKSFQCVLSPFDLCLSWKSRRPSLRFVWMLLSLEILNLYKSFSQCWYLLYRALGMWVTVVGADLRLECSIFFKWLVINEISSGVSHLMYRIWVFSFFDWNIEVMLRLFLSLLRHLEVVPQESHGEVYSCCVVYLSVISFVCCLGPSWWNLPPGQFVCQILAWGQLCKLNFLCGQLVCSSVLCPVCWVHCPGPHQGFLLF